MRKSMMALIGLASFPAAAFAQASVTHFQTLSQGAMLISNVVGLDVYDNANNDIGKI
jgi:hypothetical protein